MVILSNDKLRELTDDELSTVPGGVVAEILIGVGCSVLANWLTNGSGNGRAWNENFKSAVGVK